MDRRRILVVEDSPTQAFMLATLLREHGYDSDIAVDGDIALERIQHEPFDLVLSDVVMERVGGYELCRRVKQQLGRRDLPVVLLTTLTDPLDIVRGLECGADNYIAKPFDAAALVARVQEVLERATTRAVPPTSAAVAVEYRGTTYSIASTKEQMLDLLLSSVEDVIKANRALHASQRQLAETHTELEAAHEQLAEYATELERRERLTQEKYGSLMRGANDGIFVLDADGIILEANRRAADLVGELAIALPGRAFETLLPVEQADEFRSRMEELHATGHINIPELRIVQRNGSTLFCELRASTAHGGENELVLALLHDVTEQRLALEAVREGKATLQTLIEASPLAIVSRDRAGMVTLWNKSAERIFGWAAGEVLGRYVPTVPASKRSEFKELESRLLSGEAASGFESVRITKSGKLIEVTGWAAPLRDSQGGVRGIVTILADMTEQKALERQLFQAQKMEAVGALAGGIAHDFNNIVTAITGYSDVLLADPRQSAEARADIRDIQQAASRAAALTRQLLAFSRKQMLQPEMIDVNRVVGELEKMLRRLIREDIELVLDLESQVDSVVVDSSQLQQVILNLVLNARDALADGGRVAICTRNVMLDADAVRGFPFVMRAGAYVALDVIDNGIGMDASVQRHIFEPFYTTKSKDKGTGLGLSVAYGIVKQSGGFIIADSAPGQGTTMTVYLPVAQKASAESRASHVERSAADANGAETVLLTEDDEALRRLLGRILRKAGYTVFEAEHPVAALKIAAEHSGRIDVLLTDVVMPDMSGLELAQRITALRGNIKTMCMSGYSEDMLVQDARSRLGIGFLEKPFSTEALLQRLRDVLTPTGSTER